MLFKFIGMILLIELEITEISLRTKAKDVEFLYILRVVP